jgi:tetratricopeptide (TPR) repeat protein
MSDLRALWVAADRAIAEGRRDAADAIYRDMAKCPPLSHDSCLFSGLAEFRLGRPAAALDILEAGCRQFPDSAEMLERFTRIGIVTGQVDRVLRPAGIHAEAVERACESVAADFADWNVRASVIEYCVKAGLVTLAGKHLAIARRDCPDAGVLWKLADLLEAHRSAGDPGDIYRVLSERRPDDPQSLLLSAVACERLGSPQRAADILEEGRSRYPEAMALRQHYLRICLVLQHYEQVAALVQVDGVTEEGALELLFEQFPEWSVQAGLADYGLRRGLSGPTAPRIARILRECPLPSVIWGLATTYLAVGEPDAAAGIYRDLSSRPPVSEDLLFYAAIAKSRLHEVDAALDLLADGIATYPAAHRLREHFVGMCLQHQKLDRLVGYLHPASEPDLLAVESLFERFPASSFQIGLIGYCLKRGFSELADVKARRFEERFDDMPSLRSLAECLGRHGLMEEAGRLHRRLIEWPRDTLQEHIISATSAMLINDRDKALGILEAGQIRYPSSEELANIYINHCAVWRESTRYRDFAVQHRGYTGDAAASLIALYTRAISGGAPEAFIVSAHDLESLPGEAYQSMREDFLRAMRRRDATFQRELGILLQAKYSDVARELVADLRATLTEHREASIEADILHLADSLTLHFVPRHQRDARMDVQNVILALEALSDSAPELNEPISDMSPNWLPWQPLFLLGSGNLYGPAMAAFERMAFRVWPRLDHVAPHTLERPHSPAPGVRKIRIAFMALDAMPMMSGLLAQLDREIFEPVFLRPGRAGSSVAAGRWEERAERVVEFSDTDSNAAIATISAEQIDIIVSGPSMGSCLFPLMARLAHLQMVLLEPNWTDGLTSADYYISWARAEPADPALFYTTAAAFLEHPPYWIERPSLALRSDISPVTRSEVRQRLLGLDESARVYLCANTPPKIHADMDDVLYELLQRDPAAVLVFLRREYPPATTLMARLQDRFGSEFKRVIFLRTLTAEDAHLLLLSVDCCLDSFPLCGMSSSFDACMLGVPVVTLPFDIPFGRWTAAIYDYVGQSGLTAANASEYVEIAIRLANDPEWRLQLGAELAGRSARYVESRVAASELQDFILAAWKRKLAAQPPADWLSGSWRERV